MLDNRLVRAINRGRCFVLVGSGPSCEIGYPSWNSLAETTFKQLIQQGYVNDKRSYESYLEQKKYPELFRQAELDIGSRARLIDIIKTHLIPATKEKGGIYEMLSKWPFACYLTTNYDDELKFYLEQTNEYFSVIRNRHDDFYAIRDGASHIIQKLHSDLDHIDEVVLTSKDYQKFYIEDEGQYFRDKLRQIFEMFDFFIIGHSLSDPDINYILQLARKTASPIHPIYMVASGFSKAEEREFFEKYNIVLIRYANDDGKHTQLRRILSSASKYIVTRGQLMETIQFQALPEDEVQAASALFLFRKLQSTKHENNIIPLILVALSNVREPGILLEELLEQPSMKTIFKNNTDILELIQDNINSLIKQKLVNTRSGCYWITQSGLDRVKECQAVRNNEKDQAYGQFLTELRKVYDNFTQKQGDLCQQLAEMAILNTFASRGLTIANKVFAGQSAGSGELSDIFGYVSEVAKGIEDLELRAAFIEAMYEFIVSPNAPQRKYLASISQGYFLFHLLGLDPRSSKLRREIFRNTLWLCDSSVLLPLVAVGCLNHEYAIELFGLLLRSQAVIYTTPKLMKEVWEHFDWADNFVKTHGVESCEFLRAALVKGSYKQNLFLDGYIRLSAEGRIGKFSDYLELIFPKGESQYLFKDIITQHGVKILNLSDLEGFVQQDWGDIEDVKEKIEMERKSRGTYRSNLQVEAEAEVWILVNHLRSGKFSLPDVLVPVEKFYFISQSRILDELFQSQSVTTWTPEAVYRYLSALPDEQTDPELLQQCMLHEYFYAGVSFIDKERYLRFFGHSIDSAKASYKQEREKYIAEIEEAYIKNVDKAFDKTPDLEKPFFVMQMGWKLADEMRQKEELTKQRAIEAETKIKQLETERKKAWKTRKKKRQEQEAARLRNLQDPKHVRKRQRQAKKRRKKNKK